MNKFDKELHPENTGLDKLPIVVQFIALKYTVLKLVQFLNAYSGTLVTFSPIVICVKRVQPEKTGIQKRLERSFNWL